jgi:hypothetical protein
MFVLLTNLHFSVCLSYLNYYELLKGKNCYRYTEKMNGLPADPLDQLGFTGPIGIHPMMHGGQSRTSLSRKSQNNHSKLDQRIQKHENEIKRLRDLKDTESELLASKETLAKTSQKLNTIDANIRNLNNQRNTAAQEFQKQQRIVQNLTSKFENLKKRKNYLLN